VAALRTAIVAGLLWGIYFIFWRKYIYIYPAGAIACITVGVTNGIGSLFYYSGLDRLDASIAQVLNANYLLFVVLLSRIGGSQIGGRTIIRVVVALLGTLLLTGGLSGEANWLGIGLMTGNALLFAGTVMMSQRVLYEMPAQTATLYIMTAMASVVIVARLMQGISWTPLSVNASLAIIALGVSTMLSRLLLFAGVKGIGGVKTTLLAIMEGAVAVSLAFIFLNEGFTTIQWIGVAALVASLFIRVDDGTARQEATLGIRMPNIADLRYQQLAFTKAFLKPTSQNRLETQEMKSLGNIFGADDRLTTDEIENLRRMLGEETTRHLLD
jgi:drug/metabolite transporter (DMT)-like permease